MLNVTVEFSPVAPHPTPKVTGWRLKYPGEGGNYNPDGMPAVTPALRWSALGWQKYISHVIFDAAIQNLAWQLMKYFNPATDVQRFEQLYDYRIALTNEDGFGDPSDPRWNHITDENKGAPEPKLKDGIIMAGQLYQGVVQGNALACYPGTHAMDMYNPVDLQTLLDNHWYFFAVSWHDAGYGEHFFPDFGGVFAVPYVLREVATYPLEYFDKWEADTYPDPLRVGG